MTLPKISMEKMGILVNENEIKIPSNMKRVTILKMFNFSRYLASNTIIIIPLRPKEWYVVVLPGPFFESSKDTKCLKESN